MCCTVNENDGLLPPRRFKNPKGHSENGPSTSGIVAAQSSAESWLPSDRRTARVCRVRRIVCSAKAIAASSALSSIAGRSNRMIGGAGGACSSGPGASGRRRGRPRPRPGSGRRGGRTASRSGAIPLKPNRRRTMRHLDGDSVGAEPVEQDPGVLSAPWDWGGIGLTGTSERTRRCPRPPARASGSIRQWSGRRSACSHCWRGRGIVGAAQPPRPARHLARMRRGSRRPQLH
jgi:hypothetical protein